MRHLLTPSALPPRSVAGGLDRSRGAEAACGSGSGSGSSTTTTDKSYKGTVTSVSCPTSFSVDGIPVDASAAPMTLVVGTHVEIHGTVSDGVMVASSVKIEGQSDSGSSSSGSDGGKDDGKDDHEDDSRCTTTATTGSKSSDCEDDRTSGKR